MIGPLSQIKNRWEHAIEEYPHFARLLGHTAAVQQLAKVYDLGPGHLEERVLEAAA